MVEERWLVWLVRLAPSARPAKAGSGAMRHSSSRRSRKRCVRRGNGHPQGQPFLPDRAGHRGKGLLAPPERGPQFGAGGFGGPFSVGSFHCFLHSRGSDFINAACASGHRYVRFYDHRQYFSIPAPGWSPPARRP